jgi:hypothetical protein
MRNVECLALILPWNYRLMTGFDSHNFKVLDLARDRDAVPCQH